MLLQKKIAVFVFSGILAASMMVPGALSPAAAAGSDSDVTVSEIIAENPQILPTKIAKYEKEGNTFCQFKEINRDGGQDYADWIDQITASGGSVTVNNQEYLIDGRQPKDSRLYFSFSEQKGLLLASGAFHPAGEDNTIVIKAKGYKNVIITFTEENNRYVLKDTSVKNTENESTPTGEEQEHSQQDLQDPAEECDYTVSYKITEPDSDKLSKMGSMVFDPKGKLSYHNGQLTLSILNNKLASKLDDCVLDVNGDKDYHKSVKKPFGKMNAEGKYNAYEYVMPIKNIAKRHHIAFRVSEMNDAKDGEYDKYTPADLIITKIEDRQWSNYATADQFEGVSCEKAIYTKYGEKYDTNHDKKIDAQEVAAIRGTTDGEEPSTLDLSGCYINDISILQHLGPGVERLNLSDNLIEKIPSHVFDKATDLETLIVSRNFIETIPDSCFAKNDKLKNINFDYNKITELKKAYFEGAESLVQIEIGYNNVVKVAENAFQGTPKLQQLAIQNNKISHLPEKLLVPVAKSLEFFNIANNQFHSLPKAIEKSGMLQGLYAQSNCIQDLSDFDFSKLPKLERLQLMRNQIRTLRKSAFSKNALLENIDLHDNQLTEISAAVMSSEILKYHKFDITLNNIRAVSDSFRDKLDHGNKIYPQKSILNFTSVKSRNGVIKWKQKFNMLDLRHWYDITMPDDAREIESIGEYKETLEDRYGKPGMNAEKAWNQLGSQWAIQVALEKKTSNGYEPVKGAMKRFENQADPMNGSFKVPSTGEYRVVKKLYLISASSSKPAMEAISYPQKEVVKLSVGKIKSIKAKNKSKRKVMLKWSTAKNAAGYKVYRANKKTGKYKLIATVKGGKKTVYVDKKLKKKAKYFYKVRGYRMNGKTLSYGKYSGVAKVVVRR